jgi:hypothetical protein
MKRKPTFQELRLMVGALIDQNGGPDCYVADALMKVTRAVNGSLSCAPPDLTMQDVKARMVMALSRYKQPASA